MFAKSLLNLIENISRSINGKIIKRIWLEIANPAGVFTFDRPFSVISKNMVFYIYK